MDRKEIELARDRIVVAMEHAKAHGIAKFPTVNADDLNTLLDSLPDVEGLIEKINGYSWQTSEDEVSANTGRQEWVVDLDIVRRIIRSHFGAGKS